MKTFPLFLAVLTVAATATADPLKKDNIPADAKWLVHLDVENLLTTQLGGFLGREILDKQLAKPSRNLKEHLGLDINWREIRSVTAYGTDFQKSPERNGVLIVKSGFDITELLDTLIDKLSGQAPDEQAPVRKVQDEPFAIYSANGVFGAPAGRGVFLLSKSKEHLAKAREVVTGKAPNLSKANSFPALPDTSKGFLAVAVADAFGDNANLPGPVKGLKNAEGGQIVAGEKDERVFLDLAVNAKDAASATQIQQVVQGLIAMAALSQGENQDLQKLVQGTKVSGKDKIVTVSIDVSSADVIAKVGETNRKRRR